MKNLSRNSIKDFGGLIKNNEETNKVIGLQRSISFDPEDQGDPLEAVKREADEKREALRKIKEGRRRNLTFSMLSQIYKDRPMSSDNSNYCPDSELF